MITADIVGCIWNASDFLSNVPCSLGLFSFLRKMNCWIYLHAVVLAIMYSWIFFVYTQLAGRRYPFLIRKWQDSKTFFINRKSENKKSVILPKELQTEMRQIEGKLVVTNNFWIISFQILSDDFENFAGKTQTFQVKPKHIRSTIPCVCMFILFLPLCYCATRKISNHSDTLFMQKTSTVECISVLKSDFIFLIKSQILCNSFSWFCERTVALRYLERRLENMR